MFQQRINSSNTMKNYSNIAEQKEMTTLETKPEVTEDYSLTDREFKIAVMKKLNKLQENSENQFNELRNKINKQKEYFTKESKTLKKYQTEILEMKNTINEMKNNVDSIKNKADICRRELVSLKIEIKK